MRKGESNGRSRKKEGGRGKREEEDGKRRREEEGKKKVGHDAPAHHANASNVTERSIGPYERFLLTTFPCRVGVGGWSHTQGSEMPSIERITGNKRCEACLEFEWM